MAVTYDAGADASLTQAKKRAALFRKMLKANQPGHQQGARSSGNATESETLSVLRQREGDLARAAMEQEPCRLLDVGKSLPSNALWSEYFWS
jgi:hypothetical protein